MNYEKLSSTLAVLMFEYENFKGEDFLSIQPSRPQAVSNSENGMPQATVFIHCEEDAVFEDLPGIIVNSGKGKIRTAQVELKKIGDLSDMQSVRHISSSMRLKPSNDFEAIGTAMSGFKTNHSDSMAEAAIIGVIDSGINSALPVFANRIHSVWDQGLPGDSSETVKYGKVLSEGAFQESLDFDGYGTQSAKILTEHFIPEAKLVVVKTDFQTAHVADGIRYIFETASKLGKSAVISLNLDGYFGVPDETDDLSAFILQETETVNHVVSATESNKSSKNKQSATIEPNAFLPKRIKFKVLPDKMPGCPVQVVLRGWFEDSGECEITIMAPNGMATKSTKPGLSENPTRYSNYFTSEAFLTVPKVSSVKNGKKEFYIDLRPVSPKQFVAGGSWQLTIKNVGHTVVNLDLFAWVPEKPKDVEFL